MKSLKYVKLFESFVNEELSPELKKRTYDAMMKIANDPNAIDNLKRMIQADNVMSSLSPEVEKLKSELQAHSERIFKDAKVVIVDSGLAKNQYDQYVQLIIKLDGGPVMGLMISKDKYEKFSNFGSDSLATPFYTDRAFVNTLKKLIVQIQKDEIPGDDPVPTEPTSISPEGSI